MLATTRSWLAATALAMLWISAVPGAAAEPSRFRSSEDGAFDVSAFLDEKYGFLPLLAPITEPAVGFGGFLGLAFINQPLAQGRPNISVVGGLGTANGTWGALAGDVRYWLDGKLQTVAGLLTASANLDFYDQLGTPRRFTLAPQGGTLQAKYRVGESRFWLGASYALMAAEATFAVSAQTPSLPGTGKTDVGGITPSLTYDTRDNVFTPLRGTYVEATVGLFDEALGGDDAFQRARVMGMQFFALPERALYLGYRGEVAASFGEAPFYLRPYVSLRGAPVLRYQGEEIAQVESEARWQCYKRSSVLGFVGVGAAWSDLEGTDPKQTVLTGGVGYRYEIARTYGLHVGFDLAFGPDQSAVYVQMGSAWARP